MSFKDGLISHDVAPLTSGPLDGLLEKLPSGIRYRLGYADLGFRTIEDESKRKRYSLTTNKWRHATICFEQWSTGED